MCMWWACEFVCVCHQRGLIIFFHFIGGSLFNLFLFCDEVIVLTGRLLKVIEANKEKKLFGSCHK